MSGADPEGVRGGGGGGGWAPKTIHNFYVLIWLG